MKPLVEKRVEPRRRNVKARTGLSFVYGPIDKVWRAVSFGRVRFGARGRAPLRRLFEAVGPGAHFPNTVSSTEHAATDFASAKRLRLGKVPACGLRLSRAVSVVPSGATIRRGVTARASVV